MARTTQRSKPAKRTASPRSLNRRGKRGKSAQSNGNAEQTPQLSKKEQRLIKHQAAKARRELIQHAVTTVFIAGMTGLLFVLLGEPKLGAAAVVGITCLSLSVKYPRQAMFTFPSAAR